MSISFKVLSQQLITLPVFFVCIGTLLFRLCLFKVRFSQKLGGCVFRLCFLFLRKTTDLRHLCPPLLPPIEIFVDLMRSHAHIQTSLVATRLAVGPVVRVKLAPAVPVDARLL